MSLRANSPAPNDQVQRVWTKRRLRLVRHWASAGSTKWIKARYSAASIFVVLMFAALDAAASAAAAPQASASDADAPDAAASQQEGV